jgi:hypothetical protein
VVQTNIYSGTGRATWRTSLARISCGENRLVDYRLSVVLRAEVDDDALRLVFRWGSEPRALCSAASTDSPGTSSDVIAAHRHDAGAVAILAEDDVPYQREKDYESPWRRSDRVIVCISGEPLFEVADASIPAARSASTAGDTAARCDVASTTSARPPGRARCPPIVYRTVHHVPVCEPGTSTPSRTASGCAKGRRHRDPRSASPRSSRQVPCRPGEPLPDALTAAIFDPSPRHPGPRVTLIENGQRRMARRARNRSTGHACPRLEIADRTSSLPQPPASSSSALRSPQRAAAAQRRDGRPPLRDPVDLQRCRVSTWASPGRSARIGQRDLLVDDFPRQRGALRETFAPNALDRWRRVDSREVALERRVEPDRRDRADLNFGRPPFGGTDPARPGTCC